MKNKSHLTIIFCGGIFLFIDQILKYYSQQQWNEPILANKFFGWQPYLNYGAAFGLPVPNWLIILFTIPIILIITYLFLLEKKLVNLYGYILILAGSLSNLFDRLYYRAVIDYWQFTTGIINLADVMIVAGITLIILTNKQYLKIKI